MSRLPSSNRLMVGLLCLAGLGWLATTHAAAAPAIPEVLDPRLELTLIVAEPDLVTPIGLATDARDRVFVIESHTHQPPQSYAGPKADRIKFFTSTNALVTGEAVRIYADGFEAAMNLTIGPTGDLFLVCAREVWWLRDGDDDGVAEVRTRILKVETDNSHPHSCLLGVALGPDGRLYVSRGNNGGMAWKIVGSDGSSVAGYGDGGNVIRCQPDGSKVEAFATGFWNPFDLAFGRFGRLLVVDNDPDARGPNRFLHVVRGGDYGYRSLHGPGGNHPYQAWSGDLPGTLPMIAGTGEAPAGLLDCSLAALPADYRNNYLITLWNENTIHRFGVISNGVSLAATNSVLIAGGKDFRPVAFAPDSRGAIYFTDWAKVDYPNHGHGRLWRLAAKKDEPVGIPRNQFGQPDTDPAFTPFVELAGITQPDQIDKLEAALSSPDAFLRHAAVLALSGSALRGQLPRLSRSPVAEVRLGALLALRRAGVANAETYARRFLSDPDPRVRQMALIWIGERGWLSLRSALARVLEPPEVTPRLFATYLATLEMLTPEFAAAVTNRTQAKAGRIPRPLDERLVPDLIENQKLSPKVRQLALARLPNPPPPGVRPLLLRLVRAADPNLQSDAIRTLASLPEAEIADELRRLALDGRLAGDVRAEALAALARHSPGDWRELVPLLDDADAGVQVETVRTLRLATDVQIVRAALEDKLAQWRGKITNVTLINQLEFALHPPGTPNPKVVLSRPGEPAGWENAAAIGGDPVAGRRVFYSPGTGCARCHSLHQHENLLGPTLDNVGQSLTRAQIARAIVRPSEAFSPEYQAWFVETRDNERYEGLQLDHQSQGAIELFTTEGRLRKFTGEEVANYGALPRSLMPDGLENTMTVGDFRNLVAFLESLRQAVPGVRRGGGSGR